MPAELNVTLFELGTTPPVTVTVPPLAGVPVHVLLLNTEYVTVPPASDVALWRVAESLTDCPTAIALAESLVLIDGALTDSPASPHLVETGKLFVSPL